MNSAWGVVQSCVAILDRVTENMGKAISWLNLILVMVVFFVVILRYLLNMGSIAAQESAMYLHGIIFLGASAYTLKHDGHVRVDVFYCTLSERQKALVNGAGTLFLLMPVCLFIGLMSGGYVSNSWRVLETSQDPGGIPYIYLLKSMLLVMVATLLWQGVAELLRALLVLFAPDKEGVNNHG